MPALESANELRRGPSAEEMGLRWAVLAAEMSRGTDSPPPEVAAGRLVVLGSGLAHFDLLSDAEAEIAGADRVFHCTNDRLTRAWLGEKRPDSFDLRVLYNPSVERHVIYVRMAEAMLHHVRRGETVVAIFYGHPGVFATPAHRAISIARSEGHEALMRPGVSALDYIVADLGFDPALPGLLTYEATDMLLRRRTIDPTLHVVLWQVGVVGDSGFHPDGYPNRGFDVLVDVLCEVYGCDAQVIHYIAPQYAGLRPLIERLTVGDLRDVTARRNVSPLSTFYIPPLVEVPADVDRAVALGLIKPGEAPPAASKDFVNSRYGEEERQAVRSLRDFQLPASYYLNGMSGAADFLIDLSRDVALRGRYVADPCETLAEDRFQHLSERTRKLLAIPHPSAFAAALAEDEA